MGLWAAAMRMGACIRSPRYVEAELARHESVRVDPPRKYTQFRDESVAFAGLRVFGFLREGSTKLQLLTSLATYIDYEGERRRLLARRLGLWVIGPWRAAECATPLR